MTSTLSDVTTILFNCYNCFIQLNFLKKCCPVTIKTNCEQKLIFNKHVSYNITIVGEIYLTNVSFIGYLNVKILDIYMSEWINEWMTESVAVCPYSHRHVWMYREGAILKHSAYDEIYPVIGAFKHMFNDNFNNWQISPVHNVNRVRACCMSMQCIRFQCANYCDLLYIYKHM